MEKIKRILSTTVIFLSALGLVLCLAGIVGVWLINTPLTERLTGTFDRIEAVLVFSQDRLDRVNNNLSETQDLIIGMNKTVVEVGNQLTENSPTLKYLSDTVGTELVPKVETTAEVVGTLRGTIISINDTLVTANSIPFVDLPTLPMEQLAAIDQQLQEMVASAKGLAQTIQEMEAGLIERTTTIVLVPTEKLSALILQVQTPLIEVSDKLARVNTGVVDLNARISSIIDWVSILVSLFLAWFILSQAGLLYIGWYYWKTGTIPVVQFSPKSDLSGG